MIDFHSHIIPGIDDGAKSPEESLLILKTLWRQGVRTVVATPHYYKQNESVSDFIGRRSEAFEQLKKVSDGEDIPEIILGAEVLFTPSLEEDDLSPLYIQGTDYLLLEMPYRYFDGATLRAVENLILRKGFSPIMAHIERYVRFTQKSDIYKLMSLGAVGQINASSFLNMTQRKFCMELIKNNTANILGSDVHNLHTRPPHMDEAAARITKKLGTGKLRKMMNNAQMILENRDIYEITDGGYNGTDY